MSKLIDTGYTTRKLGFWLYLMSDMMVFAALFATFMILRHATNGHPTGGELFDLNFVFVQTMLLLVSSYTCGLAYVALRHGKPKNFAGYFIATIVCGAAFLAMELFEFTKLLSEGHSWTVSAFMSSYFALVGVHGLHILIGLIWAGVLLWLVRARGMHDRLTEKFGLFTLYWHFLDLVWIFIFSVVYMMGAIG